MSEKVKTKKSINPLKVVCITLASLVGILVIAVLALFLYINSVYNRGIYDTNIDKIQNENTITPSAPDTENFTPVLISAKVKKSTTQYNVFATAPNDSEIAGDITVIGEYLINGKIVEKPIENFKVEIVSEASDAPFTQKGEVILKVAIDEKNNMGVAFSGSVAISLKVVDDGSANSSSPYEDSFTVVAESTLSENWEKLYAAEYNKISSGNLDPIYKVDMIDKDIINVLVIVK